MQRRTVIIWSGIGAALTAGIFVACSAPTTSTNNSPSISAIAGRISARESVGEKALRTSNRVRNRMNAIGVDHNHTIDVFRAE